MTIRMRHPDLEDEIEARDELQAGVFKLSGWVPVEEDKPNRWQEAESDEEEDE